MHSKENDVVIFGAGPAGLAAALKLTEGGCKVNVFEMNDQVGGISRTINFKGYRFDLGGHRFFTKSEEVDNLWKRTLGEDFIVRPRLSRIYYRNKFFYYPLRPANSLMGLGAVTCFGAVLSYFKSKLFPYVEENTFEQWVSNRFGKMLYNIFFKTYTEKLWGIPCSEIRAEWAAQRIKGLSLMTVVKHAFFPDKNGRVKTLIDKFHYPRQGPGMMYEKMAGNIVRGGGVINYNSKVKELRHVNNKVVSVLVSEKSGGVREYNANYHISSLPITELVQSLVPRATSAVLTAAGNLRYRSFVLVGVILDMENPFPDTWIYVHSPEVRLGRIQNFGNWSPHMLASPDKTSLGLEYFCTEGDDLWSMSDEHLVQLGLNELVKLKLVNSSAFLDGFVVRIPKAYPVYDSTYSNNLRIVKEYLGTFSNLQPVGRYGMFKYNNMDHSILTGMFAAENILGGNHDIWAVNTDQEYQEESHHRKKNV